jgi:hypothetical protein
MVGGKGRHENKPITGGKASGKAYFCLAKPILRHDGPVTKGD